MIVTCERCQTHFRLDAERVTETGVLVRCSRCKHAFVVKKPDEPPDDETLDAEEDFDWEFDNDRLTPTQAQAEQARDESAVEPVEPPVAPPTPEPDLALESETVDSLLDLDGIESEADAASADEASDPGTIDPVDSEPAAAFDAALSEPAVDLEVEPEPEADLQVEPEPPPRVAEAEPFDEGLEALGDATEAGADELGSPADWDIFDAPAPAAARAPVAPRPAASRERRAVSEAEESGAGPLGVWLARAAGGAGWAATLGLAGLVLASGLRTPAPAAVEPIAVAPGITVEDVAARWVDNAQHGEVYVVSASVHNRTAGPVPAPALELVLRDAANRPLGEPIAVGGTRAPEVLREGGRDAFASAIPLRLGLRAGETRRFEAVAWPLPAAAERFELRARRP